MEPQSVISVLAVSLIGVAGLIWRLPVGTCPECTHCRVARLEKERQAQLQRESVGAPFCAVCGRRHESNEDHKL
jgi:hypothetical protein